MVPEERSDPSVVVIGAGFGGIAALIELRKRGFTDVVVLEKADDIGGVWRDNTYPGAACDVPSPFYSYSFEPNPRWPHRYSRQPAILEYIRGVVDKHDLRDHIRLGSDVRSAAYDDATGRWTVGLADGTTLECDVVVSAVGQLSRPVFAPIPGREDFAGEQFHSARWRHDVDLAGKRVAVIGTGASAVQFVPEIQPVVGAMTVFQRSPAHLVPRWDREFSETHHRVFERVPVTQLAERGAWFAVTESLSVALLKAPLLQRTYAALSERHMRKAAAAKPGLFEKIWPDYPFGCKRVLFSNDYVPALTRPNVDLVTDRIERITATGVRTEDGTEHPAEVIVWGTGFAAADFLAEIEVTGVGGARLHDRWQDGAHAYLGLSVPDFPGFLMLYGPNTNTGGGSIIWFLEAQARHVADFVRRRADVGRPLMVRPEVAEEFDERTQSVLRGSVWSQCSSWYRTASGRITTNWPGLPTEYRRQARFSADDYVEVNGTA
jgi:cation diffusion facilitator CzcD-associated flavoprotein CzcO